MHWYFWFTACRSHHIFLPMLGFRTPLHFFSNLSGSTSAWWVTSSIPASPEYACWALIALVRTNLIVHHSTHLVHSTFFPEACICCKKGGPFLFFPMCHRRYYGCISKCTVFCLLNVHYYLEEDWGVQCKDSDLLPVMRAPVTFILQNLKLNGELDGGQKTPRSAYAENILSNILQRSLKADKPWKDI